MFDPEAVEFEPCGARENCAHVCRRYGDFRRRQQRPLDVVAPILVTADDLPETLFQRAFPAAIHDQHRIGGKVVGERRAAVEKQRQVIFDAGRRQSLAHAAINRRAGRVALEARAEAFAKAAHAVGIQRQFASGEYFKLLQGIERALRLRVEAADRVDFVIQQVDAQRRFAAHRIQI